MNVQKENLLAKALNKQINKIIDYKLRNITTIESAVVVSVNKDGTVNLNIPPDKVVYSNIQNQSIYQNLNVGDCVKVVKQGNQSSNMWIIGAHNNTINTFEKNSSEMMELKQSVQTFNIHEIVPGYYNADYQRVCKVGNMCMLTINFRMNVVPPIKPWNSVKLFTLPEGLRPTTEFFTRIITDGANTEWQKNIYASIHHNGNVSICLRTGSEMDWSSYGDGHAVWINATYVCL